MQNRQHTYPHHKGEVTPQSVLDDMEQNPHAYPDVLKPVIHRYVDSVLRAPDDSNIASDSSGVLDERQRTLSILTRIDAGEVDVPAFVSEMGGKLPDNVAQALINRGESEAVAQHLSSFENVSLLTVDLLIEQGWIYQVFKHADTLPIPTDELLHASMREGKIGLLLSNRERVFHITEGAMISAIIDAGYGDMIISSLNLVTCNEWLFWRLFNEVDTSVCESISMFEGVDHNAVAMSILNGSSYRRSTFPDYIDHLEGLSTEVAKRIIAVGYGWLLKSQMHRFVDLNYDEFFRWIIEHGYHSTDIIDSVSQIDVDIALMLIDRGAYHVVISHIDKVPGEGRKTIFGRIIQTTGASLLAPFAEELEESMRKQLLGIMTATEHGYRGIAQNLEHFNKLDDSIAYKLTEFGLGKYVWKNFSSFEALDHNDFATCMFAEGGDGNSIVSGMVVAHLSNNSLLFSGEVAKQSIDNGGHAILWHPSMIESSDLLDVVSHAIRSGQEQDILSQIDDWVQFIDPSELLGLFMSAGKYDAIGQYIYKQNVQENVDSRELGQCLLDTSRYRSLLENKDYFDNIDMDDVRQRVLKEKDFETLCECIEQFNDIDGSLLFGCLDYNGVITISSIDKFLNVDKTQVVDYMYSKGKEAQIIANINTFENIDRDHIVQCALADSPYLMADNLASFNNLDMAVLNELLTAGCTFDVLDNLDSFNIPSMYSLIDSLSRHGDVYNCIENIDKFAGGDVRPLIDKAIRSGYCGMVIAHLDTIIKAGISQEYIYKEMINSDASQLILESLALFGDIDRMQLVYDEFQKSPEATIKTLVTRDGWMAIDFNDSRSEVFVQYFENHELDRLDPDVYMALLKIMSRARSTQVPSEMQRQLETFGKYCTYEVAIVEKQLREGQLSAEAASVGVTTSGAEGVAQLQRKLQELVAESRMHDLSDQTLRTLSSSGLARSVYMLVVEYDPDTAWGSRTSDDLKKKIDYFLRSRDDGEIDLLRYEYEQEYIYDIRKRGEKQSGVNEFSPDVHELYSSLRSDIQSTLTSLSIPKGVNKAIMDLRGRVADEYDRLDRQVKSIDVTDLRVEKKRQNLEKRMSGLREYMRKIDEGTTLEKRFVMNSPKDFQEGFAALEPFNQLHGAMRRLVFAWALHKRPDQQEMVRSLPDEPTVESVTQVSEFINNIMNEQVYGGYFSDKKIAGKFRRMTSTRAFTEALAREQQAKDPKAGTSELAFMASRGLLLELSGQIGGACWADKNESIAKDVPQMTGIIMKARPGTETERMVGAALLIETTEQQTGDGVLLLRGLNPKENYINQCDVDSFYESVADYVRQLAASRGLKPAIVIDDHCTGSSTNRPYLFANLEKRRKTMSRVIVDEKTTTFNGYDVTRDSYAL